MTGSGRIRTQRWRPRPGFANLTRMGMLRITKRKVSGGTLAFIGYMLSPLSWWNDLFVNWPLALACAWIISWFYRPAFTISLVLAYWLTNVLGFVLMQKGGAKIIREEDQPYSRKCLYRDLAISLLYTLLIVALVKMGVIGPIQDTVQKIQNYVHKS
jgi:hypothetical protein